MRKILKKITAWIILSLVLGAGFPMIKTETAKAEDGKINVDEMFFSKNHLKWGVGDINGEKLTTNGGKVVERSKEEIENSDQNVVDQDFFDIADLSLYEESQKNNGQDLVLALNQYRVDHEAAPLKLEDRLFESALEYATDAADYDYLHNYRDNYIAELNKDNDPVQVRIASLGYDDWSVVDMANAPNSSGPESAILDMVESGNDLTNENLCEVGGGFKQREIDPKDSYAVLDMACRPDTYPVIINNEARQMDYVETTNGQDVNLYIYGEGWANQMKLSNNGVDWTDWMTYQSNMTWSLSDLSVGGNYDSGVKKVYVQLTNDGGTTIIQSEDEINVTPIYNVDMGVSLTADKSKADLGDTVTYTVTVTNNGTEQLPECSSIDDCGWAIAFLMPDLNITNVSPSEDLILGEYYTWFSSPMNVAPGESETITITGTINESVYSPFQAYSFFSINSDFTDYVIEDSNSDNDFDGYEIDISQKVTANITGEGSGTIQYEEWDADAEEYVTRTLTNGQSGDFGANSSPEFSFVPQDINTCVKNVTVTGVTSGEVFSGVTYDYNIDQIREDYTIDVEFDACNRYYFTWNDTLNGNKAWTLVGNPSETETANVTISLAGEVMGIYTIAPGENVTPKYDGVREGPVVVESNIPVYATQRVLYDGTFNEFSAIPAEELDTKYYFTWNDTRNGNKAWTLVGNPSLTTEANVTITLGGTLMGTYVVEPGSNITPKYNDIMNGPIVVESDIPVYATQRVLYNGSFNEFAGIAESSLSDHYYFTWNDTTSVNKAWTLVGNPSETETANVTIKIAGEEKGTYDIAPGENITPKYSGIMNGPVEVISNNLVDIFTTQRVLYNGSFNEFAGVPVEGLSEQFYFTWNDTKNGNKAWTLVANPEQSIADANVTITIGGVEKGSYTLAPGERVTPIFKDIQDGPVEITSDLPIMATQRVIYNGSFNELAGIDM